MKAELKNIVDEVQSMTSLTQGDIVLDIGANDGTMLEYFNEGIIRVGCEPANNLVEELSKKCDITIHDFWSESVYFELLKKMALQKQGYFCYWNVYDLDDPISFVSDIEKVLDDDGIFVAQLMTLSYDKTE